MSDKLNIEQLVNSKLGEAEITPSQGAWKGIQRKLRWRKFLRFKPGQFNVYYMAGLIVAAAGLIVVLSAKDAEPAPLYQVEIAPGTLQNEAPLEKKLEEPAEDSRESMKPNENSLPSGSASEPKDEQSVEEIPVPVSDSGLVSENNLEDTESKKMPVVVPVESMASEPVIENHSLPKLVTNFTSSVQSGCAPLEVQFHNLSENAVTYRWSFGKNAQSTSSDPLFLFEESGSYTVTLRAEDKEGQSSIFKETIEVYPIPTSDFAVEKGLEGINGHVSLNILNYSSGANSYGWCLLTEDLISCGHWTSEEFQPPLYLTDLKNGADKMRLITINEFGCVDTTVKALPIRVVSNDVKIKFATAFSPNPTGPGDGRFSPQEKRIDLFHPILLEVPVEYHLRLYTKRGEIVFETRDVYQGWDGYFHEERSAGGVYVWMLEGTWLNGESFKMQGDVTLIWQDIW